MLTRRAKLWLRQVQRLYTTALVVLPEGLHREYGHHLSATFRDVSTEAFKRRGWIGMLLAWSRMFGDLTIAAPREHLTRFRSHSRTQSVGRGMSFRARVENFMQNTINDIRTALRQLRRNPAFAAAAVLTLALGIGANTAIFNVLHSVLLKPLPFDEPGQLTALWLEFRRAGRPGVEIDASEPEYLEFRDQTESYRSVAGYWLGELNLGGIDEPERVRGAATTANILSVLGIAPILGRAFDEGEDLPGAERVALIGHGLWQRSFGADSAVIGRRVLVNGIATTIVGVLPRSFQFPGYDAQLIRPNMIDPQNPTGRSSHYLSMIGRLKPGATLETARAETATLMGAWSTGFPDRHGPSVDRHPIVMDELHDRLVGNTRTVILLLSGAVALVLLIACANVAGLMLARAESRHREMAIRTAIGAGKKRLIAQLLTESIVLSSIGGVLGIALAYGGVQIIQTMGPASLPSGVKLSLNGVVLGFALLVSAVAGIAFGLAPAITAGRTSAALAFRDVAGMSTRKRLLFRRALIVTEMAIALLLAIGAGLLIKSLARLNRIDPGFETSGVITMEFALNSASYPEAGDVAGFHRDLSARLDGLPGVVAAGAIRQLPLTGQAGLETLKLMGRVRVEGEPTWNTEYQVTSVGYFDALGIPLVRGRVFRNQDLDGSEPVVIINQRMADLFWKDEDPIGKQLQVGDFPGNTNPIMTIVGVIGDVRQINLGAQVNPQIFVPRQQAGAVYGGFVTRNATLVVRAETDPITTIRMVREAIRELDANLPVANVQTMPDVVSRSISNERFTSLTMSLFSAIALALGAIGVYGLMAYTVAQRAREIGVRIALGADRARVQRAVVFQGLTLAAMGIGAGLIAAFGLTRFLSSLLFELDARDPAVFIVVPLLLIVTSAIAAYMPARKAAAMDPLDAMRA